MPADPARNRMVIYWRSGTRSAAALELVHHADKGRIEWPIGGAKASRMRCGTGGRPEQQSAGGGNYMAGVLGRTVRWFTRCSAQCPAHAGRVAERAEKPRRPGDSGPGIGARRARIPADPPRAGGSRVALRPPCIDYHEPEVPEFFFSQMIIQDAFIALPRRQDSGQCPHEFSHGGHPPISGACKMHEIVWEYPVIFMPRGGPKAPDSATPGVHGCRNAPGPSCRPHRHPRSAAPAARRRPPCAGAPGR